LHTSAQKPEEAQRIDGSFFRGGALASGTRETRKGRGCVGLRWKGIDYRHVLMKGDGQCLYRALAFHTKEDWRAMRRVLGLAASECWDVIWPWDHRAHLEEFLKDTAGNDTWGGAWQLGVAAWKFQTTIVVFMQGAEPLIFGQGDLVWGLGFSANPDGSGGHYDVYQATCPQSLEGANRTEPSRDLVNGIVQAVPEGTHQGVPGVRATLQSTEGLQEIVRGTFVLSELLATRKKRLNGGLQGKTHMLMLSVKPTC
jgi:hypothetical protein